VRYVDVPGPRVRRGFGEIAHLVLRRRRHQAREVRGRAGAQGSERVRRDSSPGAAAPEAPGA
jgi:hypothetical protein